MKVTAVIPTLNPTLKIIATVESLKEIGFERILIINDGSDVSCTSIFNTLEAMSNVIIVDHKRNQGKGRALKSAMKYFKENSLDHIGIVTLDDDGQHLSKDVINCAITLEENPTQLILGVRNFKQKDVPLKSKVGNIITASIFKYALHIKISDTQTGLRGIPLCHMDTFISVKGERFEYETNMLLYSKQALIKTKEVIIDTVYIEKNANSHFSPFKDSLQIYKQIFKYILATQYAYVIDFMIFIILLGILPFYNNSLKIVIAICISRICSTLINFKIQKKTILKTKTISTALKKRYTIFCFFQIVITSILITLLAKLLPAITILAKLLVDYIFQTIFNKLLTLWVIQAKETHKEVHPSLKRLYSILTYLCSILLIVCILVVSAITLLLKGPSNQMSNRMVSTLMETSAMKFIPRLYFNEKDIEHIINGNKTEIEAYLANIDAKDATKINKNESTEQEDVVIEDVSGDTFFGKMVILKDPSRLQVYVVDGFSESTPGKAVSTIMQETSALIGFNGGAFSDPNGNGTGGMPLGIVIKGGNVLTGYSNQYPILIGLDQNDQLFVGDISADAAISKGIRDGVSFGPALVKNSEVVPQSGSGGGFNPRTALGQRQDGSLLILVIDGRQPHSLGATYNDLALIMKEYGAINAGNLDGGSSSVLYQGTTRINALSSAVGERPVPSAFIYRGE